MNKLLLLIPLLLLLSGCAYQGPNECRNYHAVTEGACNPLYTDWPLCHEGHARYEKCLKEAKF